MEPSLVYILMTQVLNWRQKFVTETLEGFLSGSVGGAWALSVGFFGTCSEMGFAFEASILA